MNKRKRYSDEEKLAYFVQRVTSLKAKLDSEYREQRSLERLDDMENRLANAVSDLEYLKSLIIKKRKGP